MNSQMEGARDRCILCAWCAPRESLRDVRTLGPATELPLSSDTTLLVHDFCWDRLMKHFDQPPHLDELIRVLRITRISKYRGLMARYDRPPALQSAIKTIDVKDIKSFLQYRTVRKYKRVPYLTKVIFNTTCQADCLLLLPIELRLSIAQYLSTAEFLTLRLASKAMPPLFECEQFWRTRFFLHGERGYLNFLIKCGYREWRLLYRSSASPFFGHTKLNDWRKQWLSNETVRDRYIMTEEASSTLPTNGEMRLEVSNEVSYWERAPQACQSHCYGNEFVDVLLPLPVPKLVNPRCSSCYLKEGFTKFQTVMVSRPIMKIAFYVFVQDEDTFISGFDLIHRPGFPDTSFGYRIPAKRIILDLRGRKLAGFELKIRRIIGGIEALRPITQGTEVVYHDWVGDYESLRALFQSETIRLAPNDDIVAISGNFRDCRLMDLAIGSSNKSIPVAAP